MSFPQFTSLPPEIRHAIWQFSFPQHSSGVYFYGELRNETRDCEDHFDGGPRTPMIEGPVLVALCVCREARSAALEWYHSYGFSEPTTDTATSTASASSSTSTSTTTTTAENSHEQKHMKRGRLRPWDGTTDALYVSFDLWHSFSSLCWSADRVIQRMGSSITHLVLPARMAQGMGHVAQLRYFMPNLHTLSVVWGAIPTVARCDWRSGPVAAWPTQDAAKGEQEEMALARLGREPRWEIATFSVKEEDGDLERHLEHGKFRVPDREYPTEKGARDIEKIAEFLCLLNQRTWTVEWLKANVQETMEQIDHHWNKSLYITDLGDGVESIDSIDDLPPLDIKPVKLVLGSQWV